MNVYGRHVGSTAYCRCYICADANSIAIKCILNNAGASNGPERVRLELNKNRWVFEGIDRNVYLFRYSYEISVCISAKIKYTLYQRGLSIYSLLVKGSVAVQTDSGLQPMSRLAPTWPLMTRVKTDE